MGISALGTGSSILTQDLLDKLKKADEAAQIQPLDLELANQKDKLAEYNVIDANITNLYDAIGELKTPALFDERQTSVTGTSVEVSAAANSDLQDFTLDVTQLATKEINESGSYGATTDTIASGDGSMTLSVGDQDFTIDYTSSTTLEDLKKSINDVAGDAVNATIVQVGDGDFRLFKCCKYRK
jgi:flagellar hook-associated protein 2